MLAAVVARQRLALKRGTVATAGGGPRGVLLARGASDLHPADVDAARYGGYAT